MPESSEAWITLSSSSGTETSVQQMRGEVIRTGGTVYIRYEEPEAGPTGGITRSTVKITGEEIKVLRHGEVESQQSFSRGKKLPGFYRSPYTTFQMSTDTKEVEIRWAQDGGSLRWTYDLYIYDELSGQFIVSLQIQEEK